MGYVAALQKAWEELANISQDKILQVKFLADEYTVDLQKREVFFLSCNVPAKEFTAILLLHYLAHQIKGLSRITGEWLDFHQLSGIEGYGSSFRKRAVEPILRKYGSNPQGIISVLDRLPGETVRQADVGLVLQAFLDVPVLITLWKGDEEFAADANILFDKSITKIFCTEDIIVLAGLVAAAL